MLNKVYKNRINALKVLSFRFLAYETILQGNNITAAQLEVLIAVHELQQETNQLVLFEDVLLRTTYKRSTVARALRALESALYVEGISNREYLNAGCSGHYTLYNVTWEGTYLLRSLTTEFNRMLNGLDRSKWKRVKDKRLEKYIMPSVKDVGKKNKPGD